MARDRSVDSKAGETPAHGRFAEREVRRQGEGSNARRDEVAAPLPGPLWWTRWNRTSGRVRRHRPTDENRRQHAADDSGDSAALKHGDTSDRDDERERSPPHESGGSHARSDPRRLVEQGSAGGDIELPGGVPNGRRRIGNGSHETPRARRGRTATTGKGSLRRPWQHVAKHALWNATPSTSERGGCSLAQSRSHQ